MDINGKILKNFTNLPVNLSKAKYILHKWDVSPECLVGLTFRN